MGFFCGVDREEIALAGTIQTFLFWRSARTKKRGNLHSSDGRARSRNRSDVVEFVGRDRLLCFAKVGHRRSDKMFAETKNAAFWPDISEQPQQFCRGNFQFIGRGRAVRWGGGIASKLAGQ